MDNVRWQQIYGRYKEWKKDFRLREEIPGLFVIVNMPDISQDKLDIADLIEEVKFLQNKLDSQYDGMKFFRDE